MSYCNAVLIGNWSEERLKNEYEFKLFLRKRERRELLLQRSRTLFSNLLMERPLSISGTFVLFGFNVQVINSDVPVKGLHDGAVKYGLALSILVTERQVDYTQNITDSCLMTLSPITTPCSRNTFVILSSEGKIRGDKLTYGAEFLLRAENYGDPKAPPLYVRYSAAGAPAPVDRMPLHLSATKDTNCRFAVYPLLQSEYLEKLGSDVKTSAKLVIKNCIADTNLGVMNQNWMKTFFGPYEFKLFLRKREQRALLLQRSRTLFSNLLMERPLTISGTFVMFGFNVQVVASDIPVKGLHGADGSVKYGLALSSLVTERQVDYTQNITNGCLMTLSPITTPCCRNTFVILSTEGKIYGDKLKYGDEFLLRAENYGDPKASPLYVSYSPAGEPAPPDHMPLHLSATKDTNCRFAVLPLMQSEYLEKLGSDVKSGAKFVIKNCVSDTNLCVMNQTWIKTFFGPECGIHCRNYMNVHKKVTAENVFTLVSDIETKKMPI